MKPFSERRRSRVQAASYSLFGKGAPARRTDIVRALAWRITAHLERCRMTPAPVGDCVTRPSVCPPSPANVCDIDLS